MVPLELGGVTWVGGKDIKTLTRLKDTGKIKRIDWLKITTKSLVFVGNADRKISDLAMYQ